MNSTRWQQVWSMFEAALDRDADEREAFLDEACADDANLRHEVASLLDAHERPGFIDEAADALVVPLADALRSSDTLDGQTIAQYQIIEELGRGGMGVVYKAHDTRLKRTVALKFLPPYLSDDPQAKERFLVEAQAAAALDHPNICTIHEISQADDGRLFIVMPYYEGETLKEKIGQGALPVEEALAIMMQIASGLERAHQQSVVHRDIKPANLMITRSGGVKILDFGVAKMANVNLTGTGTRMGTVAYMSPEQVRGEALTPRTDIWSLGVVFYEMLTGERPFKGEYEQAITYAILHETPEPMRILRPEAPERLEQIITAALAKETDTRYPAIEDFAHALQQARISGREVESEPVFASATREHPSSEEQRTLLAEGERVQATIVVSNLAGAIDLVEALPPDEVERVTHRLCEKATEVVHRNGGVINGFSVEEIVVLFGLPAPHEDDFVRAVRMARELHAGVRDLSLEIERLTGREIRLQTGLDTGLVVARRKDQQDQPYHISGSTLQVATQLALRAEPDEILVSPASWRLIAPFFETEASEPLRLKGQRQPVTPYRVLGLSGLQTRLEAAEQAGLTAFTGREKELNTLERCLEGALEGEGQFVTIVGEAGLGKSRLLYELRKELDKADVTLIQGRCQTYGENVPLLPFIEALRHHLQGDETDQAISPADVVAAQVREIDPDLEDFIPLYVHLLSIQSEAYPLPKHLEGEYLRLAMLEGLAALFTQSTRHRPVVMLLEDWHWSDEASQDVLNQLAEMASAYALLLVVTFRPAYAGAWSNPANHTPIQLRPLAATCSVSMMEAIFDVEHVPKVLGHLLSERTGGNPFFLEEICQTLREEGTVRVDAGRVILTRSIEQFHLPDTVEAVIRTRLHRLDRHAQSVLRLASVVGREFSRGILQHVLSEDTALLPSLEVLRSAGLIQQTRVLPETTYRFKHALTREVAYESLLKHQRKVLHGQVAEALEALYPDRAEEQADLLAYHFSEAADWSKAVHYGRTAARRAHSLGQFSETLSMLENVQAWLTRHPEAGKHQEELIDVLLWKERLCETLGRRIRQQHIIDELLALLDSPENRAKLAEVYIRQGDLFTFVGRFDEAETALTKALRLSRDLADVVSERKALQSTGFLRFHQDRFEEAVSINEDLLALDRQQGDIEAVAGDLSNLGTVLRRTGDYDRGLACAQEALKLYETIQNPVKYVAALTVASSLYHGLGNDDEAEACLLQALEFLSIDHHRGWRINQLNYTMLNLSHLYMDQGKTQEGLDLLRETVKSCRTVKFALGLSISLRRISEVLVALEQHEEALPYLLEAADLFAQLQQPDNAARMWSLAAADYEQQGLLIEAVSAWEKAARLRKQTNHAQGELEALGGLARMARRQGASEQARRYYRDALVLAEKLGDHAKQGDLHNTLGIVAWQQGQYEEALAHYETALHLFREHEDPIHAGLMLNSLGVTLHKLGRHEEAITRLEEAIVLHRKTMQKKLEAHALTALGDVHCDREHHQESLPYYGASLQLRWDLGDRKGEGWMLQRLARVYARQGETARAHESLAQATEVAKEISDTELLHECVSLRL